MEVVLTPSWRLRVEGFLNAIEQALQTKTEAQLAWTMSEDNANAGCQQLSCSPWLHAAKWQTCAQTLLLIFSPGMA